MSEIKGAEIQQFLKLLVSEIILTLKLKPLNLVEFLSVFDHIFTMRPTKAMHEHWEHGV